ncbi:MAG: acyl-CoA dehydrogenase family protein [Acidimicrobiia bacterium]
MADRTIDYASIDSAVGENWYDLDPLLRDEIRRSCPADDLEWADKKLHDLGGLVGDRIARNAEVIDANPPQLVRYDRWAGELGEIAHHPATLDSKRALWDCGFVSYFADDAKARGRNVPGVVLAASRYLLSEADTGLVCSLGMTAGVADLVERYAPPDLADQLLAGLRSTDFESGTDGSMFLTERDGGSDLGATVHCVARDIGDGRVLIDGEKWFCSNLDGDAIVTLARPVGAVEGPRGLGLYLVPRYLDDGSRNHYTARRLKPKLGTRSVPTGEVELHGALGYALRPRTAGGEISDSDAGGLNRMMEMVNDSRFGVAMMGLGISRRSMLEALVWAHHRSAKGQMLVDLPLMRVRLVDMLVKLEAAFALGFACASAARHEDAALLRRILVPAAKVRLCRLGVEAASFAVEIHGGNGYCEDWFLTRQLRDAQCHPIWEGSEEICQLDVLRAIRRESAHEAAFARIDGALDAAEVGGSSLTASSIQRVREARVELGRRIDAIPSVDVSRSEAAAARLTSLLARTMSAALLLELAGADPRDALVAVQYTRRAFGDDGWDDGIALVAGRELLAYGDVDPATAKAALAA